MENKKMKKKDKTETIFTELPYHLIKEDILSRLPLISAFEFRYVCKTWQGLNFINDLRFSKLHYDYQAHQQHSTTSLILFTGISKLCFIPDYNNNCNQVIFLNKLAKSQYWLPSFKVIGSCNGFICLVDLSVDYILVCNPLIGDEFKVPGYASNTNRDSFGFGYDLEHKLYKIVLMRYISDVQGYRVYIHTLGTNGWRSIGKVKDIFLRSSAVLLNGCLHWLGIFHNSNIFDKSKEVHIINICLADEEIRGLSVPSLDWEKDRNVYHLGELGGHLVLVDNSNRWPEDVHVWVLRNYDLPGSWDAIGFKKPPGVVGSMWFRPLMRQENGEVLVQISDSTLFAYSSNRKEFRQIHIERLPRLFKAIPHAGTLFPVKDAIVDVGCEDGKYRLQ
ncbi:hypothetical protein AQUCO_02500361v1 [Aquilegia coerulea]|uniref:Uncharacterized protein n=1 Tax=Aquilegia coerulea TaxID=218851 RepID=A0A2G5DAN9_AQUCA|nr:hypothetical protein AQUCO_02500361v1 [Aquilegia coerulea]